MFSIHDENSKLSVYIRFKENIKVKKTRRHNRSLSSFLKSSDSGSFTSGLAGGHLYHPYSTFLDNLRWNDIFLYEKTAAFGICWHFLIQVAKIQTF